MNTEYPYYDLKNDLIKIEKPARYVGGEFGSIVYEKEQLYKSCISFPDGYEIGMSNHAVRILYNGLNRLEDVQCERVFAPFKDFEDLLIEKKRMLCTLESGIPLKDLDLLGFSIGYELTVTNVLTILDRGGIALKSSDRQEDDPIIIAGGPAVTNPIPFGPFFDAVFIGEAEAVLFDTVEILRDMKKEGRGRQEQLAYIQSLSSVWYPGKKEVTTRAIWNDFGKTSDSRSNMPVPSLTTVQNHGVIEIMRGCPNACRFCHAGVFYKPFRQKNVSVILEEANHLIHNLGLRNITLTSLSSGDYPYLIKLVRILNKRYSHMGVSFGLPSLRVNSVTLPLLTELSGVRKSGLTFAVETPEDSWQAGLNKDVYRDRIISILQEAKVQGWKVAKFYFMLGLPVSGDEDESDKIIEFLLDVNRKTGIRLNVNIGTFIPKPHTPFQWSYQLTDAQAIEKIWKIRDGVKKKNIKVGFHSPYLSFIEGIITRGDERAAEIVERAYHEGARFDAWDDLVDKDLWKKVIGETPWNVEDEICSSTDPDSSIPWEQIHLGVTETSLKKEYQKGLNHERTAPCQFPCLDHCGVCKKDQVVKEPQDITDLEKDLIPVPENVEEEQERVYRKAVLVFTKKSSSIYLGHLDLMHVMEQVFQRSGIILRYSEGFNPKPIMDFAQPLSLGVSSDYEVVGVEFEETNLSDVIILEKLNASLPAGLKYVEVKYLKKPDRGRKYPKLMSSYWGSTFVFDFSEYRSETWNPETIQKELEIKLKKEEALKDYEFHIDDNLLTITAFFGGKKIHNPMKQIAALIETHPISVGIQIKRTMMYAKTSRGKRCRYSEI